MATGQLWLFPPPKPLVERFGDDFFHQIPTSPGVYYFCGRTEGVLYLGKAKNLRKRLASYRVANQERMPRRTIRLLFLVERIEWDVCMNEARAVEREKMLLRVLQPKFNRANRYPPSRVYLGDSAWQFPSHTRRHSSLTPGKPEYPCPDPTQRVDNLS
ncbi:MAG: hypothetical protein DME22_13940 [Verrucomicrobia bacterium]|nr:MAG: hypothetical protein DME22_13940 [Verrucomicrobiota bacterium]